jgi:molybdopterin molybdotransferase
MSITVARARNFVLKAAKALAPESVCLDEKALGRVLAAPLRSPQPSPRWSVSAMDGFAVRSVDFPKAYTSGLPLRGTALAGSAPCRLPKAAAIRIMTGALIPKGADAIVPKELAREHAGNIFMEPETDVRQGDHVRHAGEELKRGSEVAKAGTVIHSRWIGFLNGLGLDHALIHRLPRVSLLVSGSELKPAGSRLEPGQIFDSNLPMLKAALAEAGLACEARRLRDDPHALKVALETSLASSDLLLLSGGVSVGDADYSKDALKACGVATIFWGVAQKPGKPLYFGRKGSCLVFGLPGNPSAAWVCFHEYVLPALRVLRGLPPREATRHARLGSAPKRDMKKTLFLKARLDGGRVTLLNGQQSHMLGSLAQASALAVLEPGGVGRLLEVHPL